MSMGMTKQQHEEANEKIRLRFDSLTAGRTYSPQQKQFALELIDEYGVRATSRVLDLPRRTLQRWCRAQGKRVKRCPDWVRPWAAKRREQRENWIW